MLRKISAWLLPLALMSLLASACSPPTGAERVAEMRGRYSCSMQNYVPREVPAPGTEMVADAMDAAAEGGEAAAADGEGDDGIEEETLVPTRTDVLLDLLIRNENRENLPGITLDVVQLPPGAAEELAESELLAAAKATWRIYVETSTVGRGPGTSKLHTLEDVQDLVEGDRFAAFVRHPVPPAERGDYREFADGE